MAKTLTELRRGPRTAAGLLRNFTDREAEADVFRRHLDAPAGATLPAVAFYGVGGVGKTWLVERLREIAAAEPDAPPTAKLDLDRRTGGAASASDPAAVLHEIARQLGVPCPSFSLAYAVLRHKQGGGDAPEFRHGGALRGAWELADAAGQDLAAIPFANVGKWLAGKLAGPAWDRIAATPLGEWVEGAAGGEDLYHLRRMDPADIHADLNRRLLADLADHLPARPGKACRGVLFLDTYEALAAGAASDGEQHWREAWARDLYRVGHPLLLVVAGRDRLRWEEVDTDFEADHAPLLLDQHLVGGLSDADARDFLRKSGIADGSLQDALVAVSLEALPDAPADGREGRRAGHHPFSLGLAVDAVHAARAGGHEPDPSDFRLRPNDTAALADRFLKSLPDRADEHWLTILALTPRFDADAAEHARSQVPSADREVAWTHLRGFSFLTELDEPGWFSFHARMREALRDRAARDAAALRTRHGRWHAYWSGRSSELLDVAAELAWVHEWRLEPEQALRAWTGLAETCRRELRMADHGGLLDWWRSTGVEARAADHVDALALMALAIELGKSSLGDRSGNLRRAIACNEAARHVYTEHAHPQEWAAIQNNLGIAYRDLPTGDSAENVRRAIECYGAALRVYTEHGFRQQWAMVQNNLAVAYGGLPMGDPEDNRRRAIACYEAALRVYSERDSAQDWAMAQNNLGNTYSELLTGDRAENLRRAEACYRAALRVRTEREFPQDWADTQYNLAGVYRNLPTDNAAANLGKAVACYEAALRVRTERDFPQEWAAVQRNLANAYGDLPTGDRAVNLRRAIDCYEAALRVYTERDYPREWALTQNNLAATYDQRPDGDRAENLRQAFACYDAALRVYTEKSFRQEWAMIQNNLAIGYGGLPDGDRAENLRQAIAHFDAALRVYTERDFPQYWAMTQNNLAQAYLQLPNGRRADNLRQAVACFGAAMRVLTAFPQYAAITGRSLARAEQELDRLTGGNAS